MIAKQNQQVERAPNIQDPHYRHFPDDETAGNLQFATKAEPPSATLAPDYSSSMSAVGGQSGPSGATNAAAPAAGGEAADYDWLTSFGIEGVEYDNIFDILAPQTAAPAAESLAWWLGST